MKKAVFRFPLPRSTNGRLLAAIAATGIVCAASSSAVTLGIGIQRIRADAVDALAAAWSTASRAVLVLPESRRTSERAREIVHLFDDRTFVEAWLVSPDGERRDRSVPARRTAPAPDWFLTMVKKTDERRFELPGIGAILLRSTGDRAIDRLWVDCLITASTGLAAVSIMGFFGIAIAGRRTTLLRQAESALERVAAGDLSARLPLTGAPVEVEALGIAFERMVERLRAARDRDERIATQRAAAEDEERRALARDLHDEIGPLLFAVDVDAGAIRALAEAPGTADRDRDLAARAEAIEAATAAMKREVRSILGQLRPGTAMKIGLRHALAGVVAFFADRHPSVAFAVEAPEDGWGGTVDGAITAIVRESLSNALRHARPSRVEVAVELRDGQIRVKVADDGGGLRPTAGDGGFGIVGMRERAAVLGGRLAVENRLDRPGVVVSAVIPPP